MPSIIPNATNGRWYNEGILNVPSVTSITGMYPKDDLFRWYGNHQSYESATKERDEAANRGTRIHEAIDTLVHGGSVDLTDEFEWGDREVAQIQGFINWWTERKPTLVASEVMVFSQRWGYAGTVDLILRYQAETRVWLWDVKSSSGIYPNHHLQTAAYAVAYNEERQDVNDLVARRGCLLLNPRTKKGWQEVFSPYPDPDNPMALFEGRDFEAFMACKNIFHHINGYDPKLKVPRELRQEVKLT